MAELKTTVAVCADHQNAEAAIKKLIDGGIEAKPLSVIGKGLTQ
ncbi:MAG: hypothetical protein ABJB04_05785 [Betaproteobacteria bacterium]